MRPGRLAFLLKASLFALVLVVAGGALVRDFTDPDFFWHLKSGEWIWEHRALPDTFLFASAPPATPAVVQKITMTSYWAMQVLFHLAYAAGGLTGIVVLRVLLGALLLLALAGGKSGDDFVFLGLLAFAAAIFSQYPVERPQYASFIFFGILLVLLAGIRTAPAGSALLARGAALPLLMLVWANCHGGYLVGLGMMAVWLLAESIKLLHPALDPLPRPRWRFLAGAVAAGSLASLLNPNGWHTFEVAFQPSWAAITENLSAVESYRLFNGVPWLNVYFALLGLSLAGLCLSWRRPDPTSIALLVLTGAYSFTRVRFIPFFVISALFVLGRLLSAPRLVGKSRVILPVAGLAIGLFFAKSAAPSYRGAARCNEVNRTLFPVEAADFIREKNLAEGIFNFYTWGGYLLWRLAPSTVFIDGRNADRNLDSLSRRIIAGGERGAGPGEPLWKSEFRRRGIHLTITPIFDPLTGAVFGLLDELLADPAWTPVFVSATTVVFAEATPANRAAFAGSTLPKAQFFSFLLKLCTDLVAVNPGSVQAHVARGDLLLRLGERAGALRSFEEAVRLAPHLPHARARAEKLRALPVLDSLRPRT